jgi:hypothetical protein
MAFYKPIPSHVLGPRSNSGALLTSAGTPLTALVIPNYKGESNWIRVARSEDALGVASVSKPAAPVGISTDPPGAFPTIQDIRGITLVLIQLHPELFCSHDLWHCTCSPNSEGERFND